MPLILFHTHRVRKILEAPARLGIDLAILAVALALVIGFFSFGRQVTSVYAPHIHIDLSFTALPRYTFFSLCRGIAAYALSLGFTLLYGPFAAHHRRAEKIMVPTLDVLQAIPVLGFLPGLVLVMIGLFPTREIGLELACVVMIFTAQVWNMTFSLYGSIRSIPAPLREVASIHRFSGWQKFRLLELPSAMVGLVWNSMMSMAGGWFFLTVNEAFTLGDKDFRLPGIGSYMSQAINEGNVPAMVAAVLAMVVMIVAVDQILWRPIVVWSNRFKVEDVADAEAPRSWVVDLLGRSLLIKKLWNRVQNIRPGEWWRRLMAFKEGRVRAVKNGFHNGRESSVVRRVIQYAAIMVAGILVAWGAWTLIGLLLSLPIRDTARAQDWPHVALALGASFLRTGAAVAIGAIWTLPAGILIGRSAKWSQRLQPIVQILASFPAPMLFPLVTMLLIVAGVPFTMGCVALMLLGAQWYILFNVIAGATAIPADLKEVCGVYHFSRWQRWRKLYIPCVFPYLVTGLVTATGGAWNATIVSEYVQYQGHTLVAFGLGSLISQATEQANYPLLTASVVVMAVFVVLFNRLLWKRLYRLAEQRFSLG